MLSIITMVQRYYYSSVQPDRYREMVVGGYWLYNIAAVPFLLINIHRVTGDLRDDSIVFAGYLRVNNIMSDAKRKRRNVRFSIISRSRSSEYTWYNVPIAAESIPVALHPIPSIHRFRNFQTLTVILF